MSISLNRSLLKINVHQPSPNNFYSDYFENKILPISKPAELNYSLQYKNFNSSGILLIISAVKLYFTSNYILLNI